MENHDQNHDIEYGIPKPPAFLFENYVAPRDLIAQETSVVNIIEKVDVSEGILFYYQGATYPRKGWPFDDAIFAINIAKRAFLQLLHPSSIFGWKKNVDNFVRTAEYALKGVYMEPKHMTPVAQEILKLPFGKVSKIMAHIFEYDDAYRYRLQDIVSECDVHMLFANPSGECIKLIDILISRETSEVMKAKWRKLYFFAWLLIPLKFWFIDKLKGVDFDQFKPDDGDKYWMSMWNGYNFMGETFEERSSKITRPNSILIK